MTDQLYRLRSHCYAGQDHFHYYNLSVLGARFSLEQVVTDLLDDLPPQEVAARYETNAFDVLSRSSRERRHHLGGPVDSQHYHLNFTVSDCVLHLVASSELLLEIPPCERGEGCYRLIASDCTLALQSACNGEAHYGLLCEGGGAATPPLDTRLALLTSSSAGGVTLRLRPGSVLLLHVDAGLRCHLQLQAAERFDLWTDDAESVPVRYSILSEFKYFLRQCSPSEESEAESHRVQYLYEQMHQIVEARRGDCGRQWRNSGTHLDHFRHDEYITEFVQSRPLSFFTEAEDQPMDTSPQQEQTLAVRVLRRDKEEIYYCFIAERRELLFVTV